MGVEIINILDCVLRLLHSVDGVVAEDLDWRFALLTNVKTKNKLHESVMNCLKHKRSNTTITII